MKKVVGFEPKHVSAICLGKRKMHKGWTFKFTSPQQPAVPDAIHHTDTSETLEYIQGWNDCRQLMLEMRKP